MGDGTQVRNVFEAVMRVVIPPPLPGGILGVKFLDSMVCRRVMSAKY
jgi:hypothetical protein